MKLFLTVIAVVVTALPTVNAILKTTAQRIQNDKYSVETHTVLTKDGYHLTMFRIPHSPKLNNQDKPRSVVLLQHALLSSSDCWILNGPNDALAYVLVDAGYDVWMGNARGTTYSRKNEKISPSQSKFWDFSWHEIATRDVPTMIDYVLDHTKQTALHYVGHSQGTTVFFALMSSIPKYNEKIKTAHMLAPAAFMKHTKGFGAQVLGQFLGSPLSLIELLGNTELLPSNELSSLFGSRACRYFSDYKMCSVLLHIMGGTSSKQFNYTLLPDVLDTHPAGSSARQVIHYLQLYKSGYFRQYDYGKLKNINTYGQEIPPDYKLKNIAAPVWFYYSDGDIFVTTPDRKKLEEQLPNLIESFHVPFQDWDHLDFLWALKAKEVVYDRIIDEIDKCEAKGESCEGR